MRQTLRKLYLDLFGTFAKPAIGVHIMNGHYLSPGKGEASVFREQLNALREGCTLVRIEDAVSMIVNHTKVSDPLVAFTFDDGFEEQATSIAPVLEEYGINAAFFINPGFTGGDVAYRENFLEHRVMTPRKAPMTWDQIRALYQKGHIIGSHGQDHLPLNMDDRDLILHELLAGRQAIEHHTGAPCEYYAYTYGGMADLSSTALSMAQQHYQYIFSQSDHRHYFSFNGAVINRRHFEPFWPVQHVRYFLSTKKS